MKTISRDEVVAVSRHMPQVFAFHHQQYERREVDRVVPHAFDVF